MSKNEEKIEKFLLSILKNRVKSKNFNSFDITKSDQLDSIEILNILSNIEKKFHIKFSNTDFKKKNFGKINQLINIIKKKL